MDLSGVPEEFRSQVSDDGRELNLADLQLQSAPEWLRDLTDLIRLDLSGNRLTTIPEWFGNLTALTELYLGGNRLATIPDTLGELTALTRLFLHGNRLATIPDTLGELAALTRLFLHGNRLATIPDTLGNLATLTRLSLHGNQLTAVPDTLEKLTALTELDLSGNRLAEVPKSIRRLTALTRLDLSGNQLTELPEWLGNLTALTELDLSGNQLTELPESLGKLGALTWLNLHRNQLTSLPLQLANLLTSRLQLVADENPLAEPLAELAARGAAELATFLRSLHDAEPQYEAKMLLVGEGDAGKTSLVAALKPAPFVEGRPTTHEIQITPLAIRHPALDKDMTVRAWDFGGQQLYRITHQFFLTRRALYLIVWNARKGPERDEIEDWLRRIRLRVGNDARALLVATHCAERQPELDYDRLNAEFPGMLGGLLQTDSRTELGIDGLKGAIGKEAAHLPLMGRPISLRWLAAREEILTLSQAQPQIWYAEFAGICQRHELSDPETSTLAKLMHDLGLIIYYADDEGLRDIVVLNPEWLTKAISDVLEDSATKQAGGKLEHARLKTIWHDLPDGHAGRYHPYFLRLMEKFDISYRLDGDETRSLVVQMVPYRRPALPWEPDSQPPSGIRTLRLVFRLSEPVPGLIPWLTVRHNRHSTGIYWRNGVFLRHRDKAYGSEALLELRGETDLALHVRAASPDLYFHFLRDSIEDLINRRWPGLDKPRLYIPCPGLKTDGTPCPGMFPLEGVLRQREGGQRTVTCMECPAAPEISVLLTGFTAVPLETKLDQVHEEVVGLRADVTSVQGLAAVIADTVRRVHRMLSTEVTDCPRLFTFAPHRPSRTKRARVYQDHYRLTLWCEHPGYEHPWEPATYDLDVTKERLARIVPYAILVIRTLQLIVPLADAVAVALQPVAQRDDLKSRLAVAETAVAALPATADMRMEDDLGQSTGHLTEAQGKALRALRAIIFERDPLGDFGGLRRVQAPSGDFLWVCEKHYPDYDPGLPIIR
jgi:internalin A